MCAEVFMQDGLPVAVSHMCLEDFWRNVEESWLSRDDCAEGKPCPTCYRSDFTHSTEHNGNSLFITVDGVFSAFRQ